MLRPAPIALAVALLGCGGTPTPPPPTRVTDVHAPPGTPARVGENPFRRADRDPPPPRSEPQIPAAEIDAALAAAAAARAAGDDN
ncbi:MAG TPA: hypothetical protein VIK91_13810, partial [Nannocystis sp.]